MFYTGGTVHHTADRRAGLLRRHGHLRVHSLEDDRLNTACRSKIPSDSHLSNS